jgi:alkanesulfonate monooxygenase SsuD/methylene tetrahydromethanopterin reductase-like flavin-dependent oxidoreductase (luciferase family)
MAITAEDVGFDSIWLPDHLLFRIEPDAPEGFWETTALLAGLAASTSRIEIGALVLCSGFRNPALTAKIADTIDEISGGRFVLGLGAGYYDPEYEAFGYPADHKFGRFEEALTIIAGLLRHGQVDYSGRYYEARECVLRPRGPRESGPPIMIGGKGERMLGLIARQADIWNGWIATGTDNQPRRYPPLKAQVDAACLAVGRAPESLGRSLGVLTNPCHDTKTHVSRLGTPLVGDPVELAERLRAFADQGIDHLQLWVYPGSVENIERFGLVLETMDRLG